MNTVTATAMPTIHPHMKPTPVGFAFGDNNIKMAAMIGIGLMATPRARGSTSPMTR